MVAGHICEKSGYLYVILQLKDRDGKRRQQWIATHLKTKGNKRRAECFRNSVGNIQPKKQWQNAQRQSFLMPI